MNDGTAVTVEEARKIAGEIDPRAGGFFRQCLIRAALKGAELQRQKLQWDEAAELTKRQEDFYSDVSELNKRLQDVWRSPMSGPCKDVPET